MAEAPPLKASTGEGSRGAAVPLGEATTTWTCLRGLRKGERTQASGERKVSKKVEERETARVVVRGNEN